MKKEKGKVRKLNTESEKSQGMVPVVRTIDDIIGTRQFNPFKTTDLATLESRLNEMNLADMQELAIKVELTPHHDRTIMKQRIIKAFRVKMSSILPAKAINDANNKTTESFDSKLGKEVKKILSQGR